MEEGVAFGLVHHNFEAQDADVVGDLAVQSLEELPQPPVGVPVKRPAAKVDDHLRQL
jgi:hypothetical protein